MTTLIDEQTLARAPLTAGIALRAPEGDAVAFGAAELLLAPGLCRLELQLDLPLCQLVERRHLLNLRPELRSAAGGRFRPEPPITLNAELRPDLSEQLAPFGEDAAAAAAWLQRRAQEAPDDLIFAADSWFARELTQPGGKSPRGYRTVWYHLPFSAIAAGDVDETALAAPLLAFLHERGDLGALDNPLSRKILATVEQELQGTLNAELGALLGPPVPGDPLGPTTLHFFAEEGWEVHHDAQRNLVHAAFKGEHGQVACVAQIDEHERQLLFYTLCPQRVPPARLAAMAELLARLNSGLVLGNFELDFADGLVRFKTSIDVAGDRLSTALVRRIVYPNVATLDYYLPALQAVIGGNATPLQALALAEAAAAR